MRPAHVERSDPLGLRLAMPGSALPGLVAAISFGTVLAGAACLTVAAWAGAWRSGAEPPAILTVPQSAAPAIQAPGTRGDAVASALAGVPGLTARRLPAQELAGLLSPWLGGDAVPAPDLQPDLLPATFELRGAAPAALMTRLAQLAPGTQMERGPAWLERARDAAGRWQAAAWTGALLAGGVASWLTALAARAGLSGQQSLVASVHALGGPEGMIAWHLARRIAWLALAGALPGTLCASVVLLAGAWLLAPLTDAAGQAGAGAVPGRLPALTMCLAICAPVAFAAVAWSAAQVTVRLWLRRLQ